MNIIYILNDHQAYYGHPAVQRPSFERLASGGVEFSRAYTACPLCGPARRTMLTGLYPHQHGEMRNDDDHVFDRETYYEPLIKADYDCYYFGKWHAGPGQAQDFGCKGFNYPSYNNPYTKPEYREYLKAMGLEFPEVYVEHDFIFWEPSDREGRIVRQEGRWCNEHASGIMLAPREAHESSFLAHLAIKQLEALAKQKSSQPFCMRIDFWGPHQPYFPSKEFADMYPPENIELPESLCEDVYHNHKPEIYATEKNRGLGENGRLIYPSPFPREEWKRVLARAYAQITQVDAAAGLILDAVKALGFEEDTMVIMTTDHGDALACHGGHFDKASYMPEEMVRVPLAVRWPQILPAGVKSDALVSNTDIGPTILDAANTTYSVPVSGKSLRYALGSDFRDAVVSETHGHMEEHFGRAMMTKQYKYIYNRGQLDELYDLENDSHELNNLAVVPEYAGLYRKMQERLLAWGREYADSELVDSLSKEMRINE